MTQTLSNSILAGIPLAAILVDPDSSIIVINAMAEDLFGLGLQGRHYITVLRQPALLECVENCLQQNRETQTRFAKFSTTHDMVFDAICRPVNLDRGQGALLTLQDVTPFEEAGQMRRDFVANVSHELRTPLTALAGFIETLRGPARDDSVARERFLGIMEHETSRMNRLVRDLLSLSRVESEQRIRPDEKLDVVGVIEAAVVALRPMAQENDVRLVFDAPAEPVLLTGDSDQLQQVFVNLLENGIKYGAKNVDVTVEIEQFSLDSHLRSPGVQIIVRDQGEGIDPRHLPRLTERFYRVDGHRSREMGGTGLGLAIVKHIVNRHRGRLKIESELGKGSKFTVILPVS